jgi:hypothetical protein
MEARLKKIDGLIKQIDKEVIAIAKLKTAKSGVQRFADIHYGLKQRRGALEDVRKRIYAILERVEIEARAKYEKEGIEGARGEAATAFLQELDHYNVQDRSKLDRYVKRTGNFEIFTNRISGTAVEEIMANNKRFKPESAGIAHSTSKHFRTRKR